MSRWKNALFIYPGEEKQIKERFNFYDLFPPVGLECVAATVKDFPDKITILDMRYEKEPVENFFQGVDFVGIGCNWSVQKKSMLEILEKIPPGIFVLGGGVYSSDYCDELMQENPRFNAIVRGDGEEPIYELFQGDALSGILGLTYRDGNKIIHNHDRLIPEILTVYPERSLRRYRYKMTNPWGMQVGLDTIMTSRGCQFKCEFCTHRLGSDGEERGWSYRTPENVVEEIKQIDAEMILLSDDNFTGDKDRVEKICDLLIAENIKKIFLMECRIEIGLYPELLQKLWKVGFRTLVFGIESAQNKTLKRIGKGLTVEKAKSAFKNINKVRWIKGAFFIVGYIGETPEEMLEIADFAHALKLDFITISKLRALKNSPLYESIKTMPDYHVDETGRIVSDYLSKEDIFRIGKQVGRKFYTPGQYLHVMNSFFKSMLWTQSIFWKLVLAVYYDGKQKKKKKQYLTLS